MKKYCCSFFSFLILLLFLCSCQKKENSSENKFDRIYKLDKNTKIILEQEREGKIVYSTYKDKRHGILYRFNQFNKLNEKLMYFQDTLLQKKEYYWNKNNLDSIRFSIFDYSSKDFIAKRIVAVYPNDSVFFNMKFHLFKTSDTPSYKIQLIGKGGIGVMELSDRSYTPEYINENWFKMHRVNKYFIYICDSTRAQNHFGQTYFFLLQRGDYLTVSRQTKICFVPITVEDNVSSPILNKEIIF